MFSEAVLPHNPDIRRPISGWLNHIKFRRIMSQTDVAYTILIVEDNEDVRSIFAEVFEGKGYHVLQAGDGAEALRVINSADGIVDVVLTDLRMPVMNGVEFASELKHDPRFGHIPVVLLSATPTKDSWQARKLFAALLIKPCPFSTLLPVVEAVLPSR